MVTATTTRSNGQTNKHQQRQEVMTTGGSNSGNAFLQTIRFVKDVKGAVKQRRQLMCITLYRWPMVVIDSMQVIVKDCAICAMTLSTAGARGRGV